MLHPWLLDAESQVITGISILDLGEILVARSLIQLSTKATRPYIRKKHVCSHLKVEMAELCQPVSELLRQPISESAPSAIM